VGVYWYRGRSLISRLTKVRVPSIDKKELEDQAAGAEDMILKHLLLMIQLGRRHEVDMMGKQGLPYK
jgi:hypothetical protein